MPTMIMTPMTRDRDADASSGDRCDTGNELMMRASAVTAHELWKHNFRAKYARVAQTRMRIANGIVQGNER